MVSTQENTAAVQAGADAPIKMSVRDVSISYGGEPALSNVSFDVREHEIFGIIGPANRKP